MLHEKKMDECSTVRSNGSWFPGRLRLKTPDAPTTTAAPAATEAPAADAAGESKEEAKTEAAADTASEPEITLVMAEVTP